MTKGGENPISQAGPKDIWNEVREILLLLTRTTSAFGVFKVSFPTAVDRFITLWEMAGEVLEDPVIGEATAALKAGGGVTDPRDVEAIVRANQELLTLHELIAHRIFQILIGAHRGRTFSIA